MSSQKLKSRLKRKQRIRKKITGSTERPRLSVYRSLQHIYAQIIDDQGQKTLVSYASTAKAFDGNGGSVDGAKKVGESLADLAIQKGIKKVVFDRSGYIYHGRVKALADAAREKGLEF